MDSGARDCMLGIFNVTNNDCVIKVAVVTAVDILVKARVAIKNQRTAVVA